MRHDIELPWAEFKDQVLDTGKWKWVFFDIADHYMIFAKQNSFTVLCKIHKDSGSDQTDFETNYQANAVTELVDATQSRFERDDIVLKLAQVAVTADGSGDAALQIKVPGTPGSEQRYAAGGYAFVETYDWADKISKVEVVDVDNLMGYGAGAVLKVYHDSDADEENQGWPFWKTNGTEGECEIEPMGWYGIIPSGLYLRITCKVQPDVRVKAAIWWGRVE